MSLIESIRNPKVTEWNGMKITVSKAVPDNEIWFVNSDGELIGVIRDNVIAIRGDKP